MEEQQQEKQADSLSPKENPEEPKEAISVPRSVQKQFSLLPKALSAVLHPTPRATSDPQPGKDPSSPSPADVEQLRTELKDLRDQFNQMKTQHK